MHFGYDGIIFGAMTWQPDLMQKSDIKFFTGALSCIYFAFLRDELYGL